MKTSSSRSCASAFGIALCLFTMLMLAGTAGAAPAGGGPALPSLPDGLNVAIGAHVVANSGAAPSTQLSNVDDGDGTSRWCPSTVGIHRVTIDLGRPVNVSGTGVTFSGEEGNDGSYYSVTTGATAPGQTPFPNQTAGDQNTIVQGPLYLFSGTQADRASTVRARYVTLTYRVPREQDICVQELRVFSTDAVRNPNLELGADVSGLRADPAAYTVDGQSASPLRILRDGGANDVRLRLLVNPSGCGGSCPDLANDLAIATEARRAGMRIVLDLEYSDSETSSSAQPTPTAWAGQSLPQLAKTVRRYTRSVIREFAANGTPVSQVAIGNEITQGFLWPTGKLTVNASGRASWTGLETLLKAAIAGTRTGAGPDMQPRIELDTDTGGDATTALDFFDHLKAAGVRFDVIGQTYSPWLQGPLSALKANLLSLARRFGKPIVLAAGQFPYADVTGYGDYTAAVPYPDTLPGYLISPAGQASYERDLVSLMASLPRRLGLGVFYLDPDTTGALGLFTPAGAAQPAVDADRVGSGAVLYGPDAPVATGPGVAGALPSEPTPSPSAAATLPALPAGLNVAIGARVSANAGAAPGTALSNVDDGDGTSRYCPSMPGIHRITIDLGHVVNVTGTGVTFSGQQDGDASSYTVSTGLDAPAQTPFPNQAKDGENAIAAGANYLFAGPDPSSPAVVLARYVTLTYRVAREENICVQELRVFSADASQANQLERGADLSTLLSDTGPFTLNGNPMPILDIFRSGGLNYVRLRLWVNPISGNFGTPTEQPYCAAAVCPDLANDLTMAKQAQAAGMKVLLDIHYSDTWADPQHQNVPASFNGETLPQLASSVQGYTKSVIQAFAAQGTPVSQVAIGNEITQGMLWQYTTLAAGTTTVTPAGTKTIKVVSTSGISPGDTLFIDSLATSNSIAGVTDPSTEVVKVASVGTSGADGTGITLTQPLQHSHTGPVTVQDVQDSGHLLFDPITDQADWSSLTTLIKAGIAGAQAGNPTGNPLLVQLHIDRGGDNAAATDFVAHMLAAGVHFDVIGLSYYPWYHGPMSAMKANVTALINRFHKDVLIAEDQYPQEPQLGYGLYDAADANYPDTQPGYLVSPAGQASYQRDLLSLMASMPDGHGLGVFYWDADAEGYLGQFTTGGAAQPVIDADQVQGR
jgi:arabinogalactan endo-1,4-beta-galactosidase